MSLPLPLSLEDLKKITPTDSDMQEERLRQIDIGLLDKLVYQSRQALELAEAVEWLAVNSAFKLVYWMIPNDYHVLNTRNVAIGRGKTPLEAIQSAMKKEKEGV